MILLYTYLLNHVYFEWQDDNAQIQFFFSRDFHRKNENIKSFNSFDIKRSINTESRML